MAKFKKVEIQHISREENDQAYLLSKLARSKARDHNKTVIHKMLVSPSITEEINAMEEEKLILSWMNLIIKYITTMKLAEDQMEATNIKGNLAHNH